FPCSFFFLLVFFFVFFLYDMFSHIAYEIQRIRLVLIKNNFNWHHLPCVMLSVYTITQIVQTATRLAKSATLLEKQATHMHAAIGDCAKLCELFKSRASQRLFSIIEVSNR